MFLESLKINPNSDENVKIMFNLGCSYYLKAEIDDLYYNKALQLF